MFRASLGADSPNVFAYWSAGKTTGLQRRTTAGAATSATAGPVSSILAPCWLRVDRVGDTFTAYQSKDGATWTYLAGDTIVLPETLYVGLAGTSVHQTATTLATFDMVGVTAGSSQAPAQPPAPSPLPDGWLRQDIGVVGFTGDAAFTAGTFSMKGGGADIAGTADGFHFAYAVLPADGVIIARVKSLQNTPASAKAGVMLRTSLAPGAANVFMGVTPGKGNVFQSRTVSGGPTAIAAGAAVKAPYWVKLERLGTVASAYESVDGINWVLAGSETVAAGPMYAGLAVTSHLLTATSAAAFDSVSLQPY